MWVKTVISYIIEYDNQETVPILEQDVSTDNAIITNLTITRLHIIYLDYLIHFGFLNEQIVRNKKIGS